jgi:hypothetical protein
LWALRLGSFIDEESSLRSSNGTDHICIDVWGRCPQEVSGKAISASLARHLFARLAFNLKQQIEQLGTTSTQPMVAGDYSSDLYTIHDKAIGVEMERVQMFELHTHGDERVFAMLQSARSFSGRDALLRVEHINHGPRTYECLQEIDDAIQARRYAGDGKCERNESVLAEMDAEEKAERKKKLEQNQQELRQQLREREQLEQPQQQPQQRQPLLQPWQ